MSLRALLDTLRRTSAAEVPELLIPPTLPPPERLELLSALVTEGAADPDVARWARALVAAKSTNHTLTPRAPLQALLDGLHGLVEYRDDPPGDTDHYSRVRWTLTPRADTRISPISGARRGAGDCEDLAVAFCAFARALGISARCVWLAQPGAPQNHIAAVSCELPDGGVWIETTLPGARVGEHPYEAAHRLGPTHRLDLPATTGARP